MSFMLGDAAAGREEEEELFEAAASVSGGESDDGDCFPDGGEGQGSRRGVVFAPQPLRRMNSDSIYDMTSMMSQLPAKKGLSRYYEGKSQSFACMSEVRSLEDLRKKDNPYKQKIKSCKSYVALGGKPSAGSCANLDLVGAAAGFRTPPIQNGYHQ